MKNFFINKGITVNQEKRKIIIEKEFHKILKKKKLKNK